jgi:TRAP-type C4-dicarboxylate transport system permease large subunit
VSAWGGGIVSVGLIVAGSFLVIGCFIDAIPAIIILGTILSPLAASVGMHPVHFAIIGVIAVAFGLVTPPYGLCLLISSALGGITVREALRETTILLVPMFGVLLFVIFFPDAVLALPRWLMPQFVP